MSTARRIPTADQSLETIVSTRGVAAWLLVCLSLAYIPYIGRGFIADDFSWIFHSRVTTPDDLRTPLVATPMGFYRPVVSWSFAANYAVFGLWPMGYALTNFALVAGIGVAVAHLARHFGLTSSAGLFAAALWMFNFHGIGMALTWISGRTSLLTTLFAVLAAIAQVRDRAWLAGVATLAALLSKEEPVLLPVVLLLWAALDSPRASWRGAMSHALRMTWPTFAALLIYGVLRHGTPAFTPQTAPVFYKLSSSPSLLAANALSYLDRSFTFPLAVLALGLACFVRQAPVLQPSERRIVVKGVIWFALTSALTVLVPVRSSLYACLPSVGASIAGAAIGTAIWRQISPRRQRWAWVAALGLLPALLPIYWARNARGRDDAQLSARIMSTITQVLESDPVVTRVEIFQVPNERPSARAAVGGALPHAVSLGLNRAIDAQFMGWPADTDPPRSSPTTLRLVVSQREVQRQ